MREVVGDQARGHRCVYRIVAKHGPRIVRAVNGPDIDRVLCFDHKVRVAFTDAFVRNREYVSAAARFGDQRQTQIGECDIAAFQNSGAVLLEHR